MEAAQALLARHIAEVGATPSPRGVAHDGSKPPMSQEQLLQLVETVISEHRLSLLEQERLKSQLGATHEALTSALLQEDRLAAAEQLRAEEIERMRGDLSSASRKLQRMHEVRTIANTRIIVPPPMQPSFLRPTAASASKAVAVATAAAVASGSSPSCAQKPQQQHHQQQRDQRPQWGSSAKPSSNHGSPAAARRQSEGHRPLTSERSSSRPPSSATPGAAAAPRPRRLLGGATSSSATPPSKQQQQQQQQACHPHQTRRRQQHRQEQEQEQSKDRQPFSAAAAGRLHRPAGGLAGEGSSARSSDSWAGNGGSLQGLGTSGEVSETHPAAAAGANIEQQLTQLTHHHANRTASDVAAAAQAAAWEGWLGGRTGGSQDEPLAAANHALQRIGGESSESGISSVAGSNNGSSRPPSAGQPPLAAFRVARRPWLQQEASLAEEGEGDDAGAAIPHLTIQHAMERNDDFARDAAGSDEEDHSYSGSGVVAAGGQCSSPQIDRRLQGADRRGFGSMFVASGSMPARATSRSSGSCGGSGMRDDVVASCATWLPRGAVAAGSASRQGAHSTRSSADICRSAEAGGLTAGQQWHDAAAICSISLSGQLPKLPEDAPGGGRRGVDTPVKEQFAAWEEGRQSLSSSAASVPSSGSSQAHPPPASKPGRTYQRPWARRPPQPQRPPSSSGSEGIPPLVDAHDSQTTAYHSPAAHFGGSGRSSGRSSLRSSGESIGSEIARRKLQVPAAAPPAARAAPQPQLSPHRQQPLPLPSAPAHGSNTASSGAAIGERKLFRWGQWQEQQESPHTTTQQTGSPFQQQQQQALGPLAAAVAARRLSTGGGAPPSPGRQPSASLAHCPSLSPQPSLSRCSSWAADHAMPVAGAAGAAGSPAGSVAGAADLPLSAPLTAAPPPRPAGVPMLPLAALARAQAAEADARSSSLHKLQMPTAAAAGAAPTCSATTIAPPQAHRHSQDVMPLLSQPISLERSLSRRSLPRPSSCSGSVGEHEQQGSRMGAHGAAHAHANSTSPLGILERAGSFTRSPLGTPPALTPRDSHGSVGGLSRAGSMYSQTDMVSA